MKLINLLVKELPKRGGWPDGAMYAVQDASGVIIFSLNERINPCFVCCSYWAGVHPINRCMMVDELGAGYGNTIITRDEYEKALQESKPKAIGKMIPAEGNSWPAFEFVSITPIASNGRPKYIGHKANGSEYDCYGRWWIPEMYEQKSDNDKLNDSIERAENNFIDAAAKLVVAKLVGKAIKEVYAAGESLKNNEAPISKIGGVDFVNHPPHYQSDNGVECIDAIRAALGKEGFISHCRGTAIKYLYRAPNKDAQLQDLKKAAWYVQKAIEEMEKK